jgi:hypothetical protein
VNLGTRHGAEASDTLKYFAERLPATFVYAGINVERAGLLNGNRGEQIAGCFSMIRTGAFGRAQQWQALVAALESSLRLPATARAASSSWPATCTTAATG